MLRISIETNKRRNAFDIVCTHALHEKKTTKIKQNKQTKPSRKSICSQVIHARCSESAKVGKFFFIAKSYFPFTVIVLIMRREEREKKKPTNTGVRQIESAQYSVQAKTI